MGSSLTAAAHERDVPVRPPSRFLLRFSPLVLLLLRRRERVVKILRRVIARIERVLREHRRALLDLEVRHHRLEKVRVPKRLGRSQGRSIRANVGVELKGIRWTWDPGRRDAPGKVLKERRSPRQRGRMGTSVQNAPQPVDDAHAGAFQLGPTLHLRLERIPRPHHRLALPGRLRRQRHLRDDRVRGAVKPSRRALTRRRGRRRRVRVARVVARRVRGRAGVGVGVVVGVGVRRVHRGGGGAGGRPRRPRDGFVVVVVLLLLLLRLRLLLLAIGGESPRRLAVRRRGRASHLLGARPRRARGGAFVVVAAAAVVVVVVVVGAGPGAVAVAAEERRQRRGSLVVVAVGHDAVAAAGPDVSRTKRAASAGSRDVDDGGARARARILLREIFQVSSPRRAAPCLPLPRRPRRCFESRKLWRTPREMSPILTSPYVRVRLISHTNAPPNRGFRAVHLARRPPSFPSRRFVSSAIWCAKSPFPRAPHATHAAAHTPPGITTTVASHATGGARGRSRPFTRTRARAVGLFVDAPRKHSTRQLVNCARDGRVESLLEEVPGVVAVKARTPPKRRRDAER
eukprot:31475-Pelagococcus_subviridis.AAC.10